MPAANGAAFVAAMDQVLCGLERDALASAKEVERIRQDLVRGARRDGQEGLNQLQAIRIGRQTVLAPTTPNFTRLGITSRRVEERFSRFRLQWLDKQALREQISEGFSKADQRKFFRHSNRLARNAKSFLREISELEPDLDEEVAATIRQIDDARNDLLKLELRSWTQMDETLRRAVNGRATRSATRQQVRTYDINRNLYNLSLVEHPKAVVRDMMALSAERMARRVTTKESEIPKRAFMVAGMCRKGEAFKELNPGGRTAQLMWGMLSLEELADRNAKANIARQTAGSTFRGLGEGPNTQEWYLPVPPENVAEVRELMAARRAAFLRKSEK